jgi:hypothetical protein
VQGFQTNLQPVRVRVHGQLGRKDGGEEEIRDLQRPPELSLHPLLGSEAVGELRLNQVGDEVLPQTAQNIIPLRKNAGDESLSLKGAQRSGAGGERGRIDGYEGFTRSLRSWDRVEDNGFFTSKL